jgi:hypothetical protein
VATAGPADVPGWRGGYGSREAESPWRPATHRPAATFASPACEANAELVASARACELLVWPGIRGRRGTKAWESGLPGLLLVSGPWAAGFAAWSLHPPVVTELGLREPQDLSVPQFPIRKASFF